MNILVRLARKAGGIAAWGGGSDRAQEPDTKAGHKARNKCRPHTHKTGNTMSHEAEDCCRTFEAENLPCPIHGTGGQGGEPKCPRCGAFLGGIGGHQKGHYCNAPEAEGKVTGQGELCEVCGERYPFAYYAMDHIWLACTGQEDGKWCPDCLRKAAKEKGITLYWHVGDRLTDRLVRDPEHSAPEGEEPAGVTEGEVEPADGWLVWRPGDPNVEPMFFHRNQTNAREDVRFYMRQDGYKVCPLYRRPAPPVEREPIERVRNILKEIESVRQQVDTQEWGDVDDELWTAHRHLVTAHAILAVPTKEES